MARKVLFLPVVFLALILPLSLTGQQGILPVPQQQNREEQAASEVKDSVEIVPIAITDIPSASNEAYTNIAEAYKYQMTGQERQEFSTAVDSFFSESSLFLADSAVTGLENLSARELENLENRVDLYLGQLKSLESKLAKRSVEIEGALIRMNRLKQQWELTMERTKEEPVPASIEERIGRVIRETDSLNSVIQTDLEFLLDQQGRLSDRNVRLTLLQEQIREKVQELGGDLFVRTMPGLIPSLAELGDTALIRTHIQQIRSSIQGDTSVFMRDFRGTLVFFVLFFLGLLGVTTWYRLNYKKIIFMEKVEESEFHMILIRAPFLTSLFLTSIFTRFFYPDLPHTYSILNLVILMVPTFIFVIRMFHQHVKTWFGLLLSVFVIAILYEFLLFPDILLRLLLLVLSAVSLAFFLWILRNRPTESFVRNNAVYKMLRGIIIGFTAMLAIAIVANLAGAFQLAEFFTLAPIEIFLLALSIFVTTKVAGAMIYLLLISQWLHKLNFVREEFQLIYKKTNRLLRIILWLIFSVRALRILLVKEAIFDWGNKVLTTGWKIGEINITPASILIFVFVIWLSVAITRLITKILEKDVFVRLSMARGTPSTVIMLLRIALIAGGFFLAAAAAGMELTNLSIVLGAFSVGIGFGLQNIFNNMVSGLILAFERPIKVGDTVQVGELMGTVLTIGLRSSVVRSFDGAEVIVPNGNLISDQMINWTRSDSNRRMDIRIGVAYGTDPEKVLDILLEVARTHEKVDKHIEPRAYFIGFGDSSLDFRLLAWTDIEYRLPTESEIHVTVNRKLKEAGIEIPFPQRDLHIRSDATKPPPPRKEGRKGKEEDSVPDGGKDPAAENEKSPPAKGDQKPSPGNRAKPARGDGIN